MRSGDEGALVGLPVLEGDERQVQAVAGVTEGDEPGAVVTVDRVAPPGVQRAAGLPKRGGECGEAGACVRLGVRAVTVPHRLHRGPSRVAVPYYALSPRRSPPAPGPLVPNPGYPAAAW